MAHLGVPTEHQEQVAFVQWFRLQYPRVRIFAIPNGGLRGKITAVKMKAEGVSPGVPDLYIPAWRLWIEMKRRKNAKLSEDQVSWIDYLREEVGDSVMVAYGADEAISFVKKLPRITIRET
jgi:hypothetical protein